MAKMCPMGGCKTQSGLCGHEKAMVVMGSLVGVLAAAHFWLNLF